MEITNTQVFGFESALRAMRNPKNSWDFSDSFILNPPMWSKDSNKNIEAFVLGPKDKILSQTLTKAGSEHCKHLRMIQVWFDLDFPRYGWQEMDTYKHMEKISCSTMHKLFERELRLDDFEVDGYDPLFDIIITELRNLREKYINNNKDFKYQLEAKKILPESFLQLRTVNTNYQQLLNIYYQRRYHKLPIWRVICRWIEQLPYFVELTGITVKK